MSDSTRADYQQFTRRLCHTLSISNKDLPVVVKDYSNKPKLFE